MATRKRTRPVNAEQQATIGDASIDVSVVQQIPLSLIDPPVANPRERFDETAIEELAANLRDVGLLQPVVVRPVGDRFELVAGERRLRAVSLNAKNAGDDNPLIAASVRDLGDKEAAEVRLCENVERQSLTELETARGFQTLLELGHTVESLAELIHATPEAVEKRVQLFELPAFWIERLAEERDTRFAAACEMLLPYRQSGPVLEAAQVLSERWPMPLANFRRELVDIVLRLSRDMDPGSPVGPLFEVNAKLRDRLQCVELRIGKEKQLRALNCDLFDELNDAATAIDTGEPTPATVEPAAAEPVETTSAMEESADQTADAVATVPMTSAAELRTAETETAGSARVSRNGSARNGNPPRSNRATPATSPSGTTDTFRNGGGEPAAANSGPDESDYDLRLARWLDRQLREWIAERVTAMELPELRALADSLSIDVAEKWQCTRQFLELHSGPQIRALAEEWAIDVSDCRDRGESIAVLLHARPGLIPAAVLSCEERVEAATV